MNDLVRLKLAQLIAQDEGLLNACEHLVGRLRDECNGAGCAWRDALLITLRYGIPQSLQWTPNTAAQQKIDGWAAEVGELVGLSAPLSQWAVETWAELIGQVMNKSSQKLESDEMVPQGSSTW